MSTRCQKWVIKFFTLFIFWSIDVTTFLLIFHFHSMSDLNRSFFYLRQMWSGNSPVKSSIFFKPQLFIMPINHNGDFFFSYKSILLAVKSWLGSNIPTNHQVNLTPEWMIVCVCFFYFNGQSYLLITVQN